MRRKNKTTAHRSQRAVSLDEDKQGAFEPGKRDWKKWLEHWETWNAIVADVKPPGCGLYGCDEKIKVGNRWKCVACGKITDD